MLSQKLSQSLLQKLSPQQIQLMQLLQMPVMSLEQRIKQEIEENPALEEGENEEEENQPNEENDLPEDTEEEEENEDNPKNDDDEFLFDDYMDDDETPAYKLNANNTSPDDERKEIPYASSITFNEQLLSQLGLRVLDSRKHLIAEQIIGNIDESGYLQRDPGAMVDDIAFSLNLETTAEELNELIAVIQEFDPPGVGARNLKECLLLQLNRIEHVTNDVQTAIFIISKYFKDFTQKHYKKISKSSGISDENLKNAINLILQLNPKPGSTFIDNNRVQFIVPDYIITHNNGEIELTLNSRNYPELRVSKSFQEMLKTYSSGKRKQKSDRETISFVKQKIESAKSFIEALDQRQSTLFKTMKTIIDYQKEYFIEGDETLLKPMKLKDIAEKLNLDISTISRIASSKYVQTPFGTLLLKSFFSESITTDSGEEVSNRKLKRILLDCIDSEDKQNPLNDDALTKILIEKGYNISRRTIAKYREGLHIPMARMRKEI